MAHGIESRVPFLDHPIVEFRGDGPLECQVQGRRPNEAFVARNALGSALPPSILNRKDKMGFPVPLNEWMRYNAAYVILSWTS